MKRISKHEYYLQIAEAVAQRSTCMRRMYGAIVVKNDSIVSTGYNGSPRNAVNCSDVGKCSRQELNIPAGERYELCRSVHAEQNAIISANRQDLIGATLYLSGIDAKTGERLPNSEPCLLCKRFILNAGITNVVMRVGDEFQKIDPNTWNVLGLV